MPGLTRAQPKGWTGQQREPRLSEIVLRLTNANDSFGQLRYGESGSKGRNAKNANAGCPDPMSWGRE